MCSDEISSSLFNRLFTFFADNMATIIHHTTCVCCGSTAINKVIECKDYTVSGEFFEVWHCQSCTFRFTQNIPAEDEIGDYYASADYVSHSDTKEGLINRLYHIVRNHTLTTKKKLINKVTGLDKGKLLDIGAGTGAFSATMNQAGWQITGLEPDSKARDKASELYSLQLQELDQLKVLENGTFDAITLWHVLEHVHELHHYLETFHKILKANGRLVIAVPNYTSYDAQVYGQSWAAYDVPRHLYHFSPQGMEVLLNNQGFILDETKPMWFDSFYVSLLSERYKHDGQQRLLPAVITGLLSNLKALFNNRKCSSVIYIIKKK